MMPKCKSCGAEIIWSTTINRKPIPLDAKPEKRFIVGPFEQTVLPDKNAPKEIAVMANTYTSHFATCPHAAQHRKAKP